MKKPTVADVIDDPAFKAKIAAIDRDSAMQEYRLLLSRAKPIPKALWRRLAR
jgi:hypothetical protein